ncbi:hypothetical protein CICLE_v10023462mg [Citrus x clementina]|uniref:F-box domain-containing protein n=1 Tax=Citrus clementina TaxID=85681 RepID=V4TW97_CITCL|nr:hypothetical protein CICLE_v10023462mg [Citrus x clementina]
MDDSISELPDEILINVLSRLTMKEAVLASVLSITWRYLWKFFSGCLDFDDPLTMADLKYDLGMGTEALDVERNKFTSWVNFVLRSLQCRTIEGLRICFDVVCDDDIANWINFATERRVQKLELDFTKVQFGSRIRQYNFTSHLDSYSNFRSLTSLRLTCLDITGEAVENLLSNCPLLEVLISGASLKLRRLELKYLSGFVDLEIDAANLISFEFFAYETTVSFVNVPNLAEVPEAVPYNIPIVFDLKHLELTIKVNDDDCFLPCAAFLKASPSLHRLTLKLFKVEPSSGFVRTVKDHPYVSLRDLSIREVELIGFMGLSTDTEFLICLIENAKQLDKVTHYPCPPFFLGKPIELCHRDTKEYQSIRKRAVEFAANYPQLDFVIP